MDPRDDLVCLHAMSSSPSTTRYRISMTSPSKDSSNEDTEVHNEVFPAIPQHWKNEYRDVWPRVRPLLRVAFAVLCLLAFAGRPSMDWLWPAVHNDEQWRQHINRMVAAANTTNLIVSTVLCALRPLWGSGRSDGSRGRRHCYLHPAQCWSQHRPRYSTLSIMINAFHTSSSAPHLV